MNFLRLSVSALLFSRIFFNLGAIGHAIRGQNDASDNPLWEKQWLCGQFIEFDWTAAIMGQTTKKSLQLGNETNLAELLPEPVTSERILDQRRRWWRGFDGLPSLRYSSISSE
jgi:hypothetical protein